MEGLKRTGVKIPNLDNTIRHMSGGQRQCVAIARAATFASKLIIMDEPTAALGVQETAQVEKIIRGLKARGIPLILISHNLRQVFDLVDRIVVFRRGRICANLRSEEVNGNEVVAYITGVKGTEAGTRRPRSERWTPSLRRATRSTRAIVTGGAQGLGPRHRPSGSWPRAAPGWCWPAATRGRARAAVRALAGWTRRFVPVELARVEDCFALVDAADAADRRGERAGQRGGGLRPGRAPRHHAGDLGAADGHQRARAVLHHAALRGARRSPAASRRRSSISSPW